MRKRQSSPISETKQRRAKDDRLVDEVRADITRRVDGRYLPTVLSRETLTNAIRELEDSQHIEAVADGLNYRKLRYWIADIVGIDYDPAGERRYYPFRKAEVQRIDYALDDIGLEPDAEINTDDPPLAHEPAPTSEVDS